EFDRSQLARQRGVQRFGGTPHTESAVESGLAWLAAHQSSDGSWSRFNFADNDPPDDRCTGQAIKRIQSSLQPGLTGLCLLAFLGAGYTDTSGPYLREVRKAIDALLEMQQPHGGFSRDERMAGYNDSIATFALAECYAMTRDARLIEPLQRAVGRLVRSQQELGGWDYLPRPNSGRNDTSITAWAVQALHACTAAGIDVPRTTLVRAALHFAHAAGADGRVWYSDGGTGYKLDANLQPRYRYGPAMTAAGLMCEQLLGWRLEGPKPRLQTAWLFHQPPSAARFHGRDSTQLHNPYYWYYGTVAMFQRGGQDWERWNSQLRDAILPLQNREKTAEDRKRAAYGSWDPYSQHWGKWGKMGGRVYTTAICVLTLEIYYRHTPAYLTEKQLVNSDDWRAVLADLSPRRRWEAIACLEQLRVEVSEPVLVEMLDDHDHQVALAAAEALTRIDSPLGLTLMNDVVTTLPPWGRHATENALNRARELMALPPAIGTLHNYDPESRTATLELPRAYLGMPVTISRADQELARLQVVRRYTGSKTVHAIMLEQLTGDLPRAGDVAIGY
ncbi:MAG: HEAT repeat domain-containing protein, partial [Planctomycetota bacterium]